MNRVLLGTPLGMAFGLMDVAMTVFGNHPERTNSLLLQTFFSRFAIGSLAANRLPDAFALKACAGASSSAPWQAGWSNPGAPDLAVLPHAKKGYFSLKKNDHRL
jgi:hypothetical protein